jgi:hypothetical protein
MNPSDNYPCPDCDNSFHKDHIAAWLLVQSFCPVCRKEMPLLVISELAPQDQQETERLMDINRSIANAEVLANKFEKKYGIGIKQKKRKLQKEAMLSYEPPPREKDSGLKLLIPLVVFGLWMLLILYFADII